MITVIHHISKQNVLRVGDSAAKIAINPSSKKMIWILPRWWYVLYRACK